MAVARVSKITAASKKGFQEATQEGLERATKYPAPDESNEQAARSSGGLLYFRGWSRIVRVDSTKSLGRHAWHEWRW